MRSRNSRKLQFLICLSTSARSACSALMPVAPFAELLQAAAQILRHRLEQVTAVPIEQLH